MQSTAIVSSSKYTRGSRLSHLGALLTPIRRYHISQDGETVSRGAERFTFVCFCDELDIQELFDTSVSVGRCIGFIRDSDNYQVRSLHCSGDNYLLLKGPCGDELFRQVR